jgi:hypothetical protein
LQWEPPMSQNELQAIEILKQKYISLPASPYSDQKLTMILVTDAYDCLINTIQLQKKEQIQLVAFNSTKIIVIEFNYVINDKDIYIILSMVKQ